MVPHVIHGRSGQHAYKRIIENVVTHGRDRAPRGQKTKDLGFTVIHLESPLNALPLGCGRDLSRNVAVAETVQLIGAFSDPRLLVKASPNFAKFIEEDGHMHGAYGSRIRYQALGVIAKLQHDRDTRQAIITLWDPVLDNQPDRKDYPCTVALQFEIEDGSLCMNTYMRSNDAWLGLPYDIFQFTQLQLTLANVMRLDYGWYRHTALSLHLYERDLEATKRLHAPTDFTWQPVGIGDRGEAFTSVMKLARRLTIPDFTDYERSLTPSEVWYRERFSSFVLAAAR